MQYSEKIGVTTGEKVVMTLIPIITTVIGYFLKPLVNLVEHVPFISSFELVRLIHEFDASWLVWVLTGVGLVVGLFLSMMTYDEILKLTLSRDNIQVDINGESHPISKDEFGAAFKEGKRLFIFSREGRELLQEETEYQTEDLKSAFTRFNYQWTASDPYQEEYFKWMIDDERVSQRANDILYRRKEAYREGDAAQITALKDDLDEMNIYVKDEDDIQWIRHNHADKRR